MGGKGLKAMPKPESNGGDPAGDAAKRANAIGQQIAAGILEENKASQAKGLASLLATGGKFMRWGVITFFVPFVALYAWGGIAPEAWGEQGYWPLVAGFYVLRTVISVIQEGTWGNRE